MNETILECFKKGEKIIPCRFYLLYLMPVGGDASTRSKASASRKYLRKHGIDRNCRHPMLANFVFAGSGIEPINSYEPEDALDLLNALKART